MPKKIFVSKNAPSPSRPPYVKFLLWAAVGLVVLVLLTPLFQQKSNKGGQRATDKDGVLHREIPRTGLQPSEEGPQIPGQSAEVGKPGDSKVMPIPPEIKGFTDVPPKTPSSEPAGTATTAAGDPASQKSPGGETAAKKAVPGDGVGALPGSTLPREMSAVTPGTAGDKGKPEGSPSTPAGTAPESVATRQKDATPIPPGAKSPTLEAKATRPEDKNLYTVQVGSFQEKKHADEMQRNLQKRGYKVQVKVKNHPKLGLIHVVQLEPVAGVDKANTLVAQIRNEQKVNPIIQKVPSGE